MINQITMVGRLTRDAEFKTVGEGKFPNVKLGLAVSQKMKNKDGEVKEEVCFVDCILWRQEAEKAKSLKKGMEVFVTGRLKLEKWQDKNTGTERSKHVIQVEQIIYNYKLSADIIDGSTEQYQQAVAPRKAPAQVRPPVSQDSDFEELPF